MHFDLNVLLRHHAGCSEVESRNLLFGLPWKVGQVTRYLQTAREGWFGDTLFPHRPVKKETMMRLKASASTYCFLPGYGIALTSTNLFYTNTVDEQAVRPLLADEGNRLCNLAQFTRNETSLLLCCSHTSCFFHPFTSMHSIKLVVDLLKDPFAGLWKTLSYNVKGIGKVTRQLTGPLCVMGFKKLVYVRACPQGDSLLIQQNTLSARTLVLQGRRYLNNKRNELSFLVREVFNVIHLPVDSLIWREATNNTFCCTQ